MKTLIAAAIGCSLIFLVLTNSYGTSAQWDLDPSSSDWNTADNWTPNQVPNGPNDFATFGLSNTTDVSISENIEVNSIIFTPAAADAYFISVNSGLTLSISGGGIMNNSGQQEHFHAEGTIVFSNHATAGTNVSISIEGGSVNFLNNSTADNASIQSFGGRTNFFDNSSAGGAHIQGGLTSFFNNSGAGGANLVGSSAFFNNSSADMADIRTDGVVSFHNHSNAADASILAGNGGFVQFVDRSSAGNAHINLQSPSRLQFNDLSSAGRATIVADSECRISFKDFSQGGRARVELFGDSTLDISAHDGPDVTIGSLQGGSPAFVLLGANNLTIGSNNLSTTFSGVVQDGGSLTKIGTGTLTLTGANTYTGSTNIKGGVLQVDGSITSNTFVHQGSTLAGTGTVDGNVTNSGRVSPGAVGVPGMLTVGQNYTQAQYASLMIQIAGTSTGDFSALNVLGNASLNGLLNPVLLNGFVPSVGDQFTFLNYTSFSGAFRFQNGGIFNNGTERWIVDYQSTHAILTATNFVPDRGSTSLLLTLGLLGMMIYRRQMTRKQS